MNPSPASRHDAWPIRSGAVLACAALALLCSACSLRLLEQPGTEEPSAPAETDAPAAAGTTDGAAGTAEAAGTTAASGATGTTGTAATTEAPVPPTTVRDCSPRAGAGEISLDTADAVTLSFDISRTLYECADEVGLALAWSPDAIASLAAQDLRGPLLLIESWSSADLAGEIRRLAPERIVTAGFSEQILERRLAGFAIERVRVDPPATLPPGDVPYQRVWVVGDAEHAAVLGALVRPLGGAAVAVTGDVWALAPAQLDVLRGAASVEVHADLGSDAAWQLEVVRSGAELPGGGMLIFDRDRTRRMVAIYGHPSTSQLGVLGEQGPAEGVARLRSIAEGYDADGADVVLAFEIIATVASAQAGRDGDYSNETALDDIRPWIETAAANDMYVVLDLQPGRTDFLTQAKQYEELLRLPHVGLALDPEWRLKPGPVHLRQIGTVDAAEINEVVRWLAELVRTEALPQKLLVLHQFRFSMITNRELIETPPELAVLVHMDGQGPINTKYSTWDALTGEPDAERFWWGWKNFYDEDSPTPTASQVLALTPLPLFVSYQ